MEIPKRIKIRASPLDKRNGHYRKTWIDSSYRRLSCFSFILFQGNHKAHDIFSTKNASFQTLFKFIQSRKFQCFCFCPERELPNRYKVGVAIALMINATFHLETLLLI